MFTGIVTAVGTLASMQSMQGDRRVEVEVPDWDMSVIDLGESIAVNGVCLTVVQKSTNGFAADVSVETLDCTTLGGLSEGSRVNLERALLAGTPLGGHFVSGHVDGVGEITGIREDARSFRIDVALPENLAHLVAAKGSVTIDGVSLTVNSVDGAGFSVNIVPHTMDNTLISDYQVGTRVNIEVDLVARYLERLLQARTGAAK